PLAVATVAPGVPAPHDPGEEEAGGPPLCAPDTSEWGPAQRRLGADEVALHWAVWRGEVAEQITFVRPDAPEEDRATPHEGVRRVLKELHGYVDDAPPLGRVRSSFAPDGARMLRADGPGWSLVARTDDIAFVLLDEEPGEVLPVGRGPELPGLLEALDRMAVRPT
ncbi:hypothetical protein ACFWZO_09050, partial [Streptomyces sp. NPDC059015]